jgi:hypothetical protein
MDLHRRRPGQQGQGQPRQSQKEQRREAQGAAPAGGIPLQNDLGEERNSGEKQSEPETRAGGLERLGHEPGRAGKEKADQDKGYQRRRTADR